MVSLRRLPSLVCLALVALLSLSLVSLPAPAEGAHVFDAYRLVQYDRGTRALGSRRTALNMHATAPAAAAPESAAAAAALAVDEDDADGWNAAALEEDEAAAAAEVSGAKSAAADLQRKVVVESIATLTPARVRSLLRVRLAGALLIVLPADLASVSGAQLAQYKLLEKFLATRSWDAPVYFAFDDEYLQGMIANLQASVDGAAAATATAADRYHLQVTAPEATLLSGVTVNNFHGWQHAAASATADSDSLPTIAIVANYDSVAAAPGLAQGLDLNGSGAIAVLELSRVFSRFYSEFRTHGSHNLLFVLTGLDRFNFAATKNWLRNIDSRVLESMEFALCLERIAGVDDATATGAASPLYLHVSKVPKTAEIRALYDTFSSTAAELSIPFEVVHRKINISNPTVFWQHEQFSRKRIVSATLSSAREPATLWDNGSVFDGLHRVDLALLQRNIKFVVEALAKQIYGLAKKAPADAAVQASGPISVLDGVNGVNAHFLSAYMRLFASQARMTVLGAPEGSVVKGGLAEGSVAATLESHFARFTADHKRQALGVDQTLGSATGALKFYKDKEGGADASRPARIGVVSMHAFQVKPLSFDVALLAAVAFYLLAVHIMCKQPGSFADVVEILIGK